MVSRTALLLSTALFSSLSMAAQTAAPATPAQSAAPAKQGMPKPSNLQVLPKDIPTPELMAMMRGYSKALGVECTFCHAQDAATKRINFASDAKPEKASARTMITMTKEINGKYLATIQDPDATPAEKTVTCGTCHRGNSMPSQFPLTGAGH